MPLQVPLVATSTYNMNYINNANTNPIAPRRKTVDERLHDFFENSRIKERRPLENFRGDRKIEAYRGKGFINKITTKLPTETTPKLELIRNMTEVMIDGKRTYSGGGKGDPLYCKSCGRFPAGRAQSPGSVCGFLSGADADV